MLDLIYAGEQEEQARRDIKRLWPEAQITDASDDLHRGRVEVAVHVVADEYYIGLCRLGLHMRSFAYGMLVRQSPGLAEWYMQRANDLGLVAEREPRA